jgi:hypothetical protein
MSTPQSSREGDGIVALVKQTADGLGQLIGDHLKLARAEMSADAREYGRRVGVLGAAAAFLFLGYALGWVAGALALARWLGAPLAFASVAGFHLLGGGIALAVVNRRASEGAPLRETRAEIERTMAVLSAPVDGAPAKAELKAP